MLRPSQYVYHSTIIDVLLQKKHSCLYFFLLFVFEHEEFGDEIVQYRRDRYQDRLDDLDIEAQDIDKDQHDQRLETESEDPRRSKLHQLVQETVVGPIEIEIPE